MDRATARGFVIVGILLLVQGCNPDCIRDSHIYPNWQAELIDGEMHSFPDSGFVPDSRTASALAEAYLTPLYGEQAVLMQRPFTAVIRDSVWVVSGYIPANHLGGVATIHILRRDGRVLHTEHGL